ncbi:hypothetical protein ERO13_A13G009750v2 [Gossypium hirsutum]|uniref:GIR1-like zinc ribbon domain-containing protein n=2 Tax=Gossypium TaxID=3633 RepID=A0A1U8M2C1_GOSHI|nr:uncharacterized protein LOC107933292 [Gossypium hirsutum]KAG4164348.1 hypothetical protein ERO13_A13G009750v2 [Gossypium hirsutum]TYI99338.1 hypothetical protein E1A91_A13G010600v1 [Gossypium mustelinum]
MASKIPKIKQESPMDDVRFSNTSLISNATVSMKNCSNINQSVKHDEEYRQGDARKISLTETVKEEKGKIIDLNSKITPIGMPPKDPLSTNRCQEISSASLSEMSRMLLNQQDFSGEEIEFNFPMAEEPSLVVMACTRCLMYVMACEVNPKCANCKTSDHLLDIFRDPPQNP